MGHVAFRGSPVVLAVLLFSFSARVAQAQGPETVDIDLRQSTLDANSLEVYIRANGQPFGDVFSGLTFTVRWLTTSPATLGTRVNACPDAINISATPQITNPLLNDVPTGFNYRTYNAFGIELLSEWGCTLPQDEWYLVMTVPVANNTGCTEFNIVNDDWTDSPGNARDYYLSLGGNDRTGIIEPVPVLIGDCTAPDCEGTAGGKVLPGTPCDDANAETVDDTWSAECVCIGILSTNVGETAGGAGPNVWPNPTSGAVYIRAGKSDAPVHVRVSDALGRMLTAPLTRASAAAPWLMDLSNAPIGLYLIELETGGTRSVERVIKR